MLLIVLANQVNTHLKTYTMSLNLKYISSMTESKEIIQAYLKSEFKLTEEQNILEISDQPDKRIFDYSNQSLKWVFVESTLLKNPTSWNFSYLHLVLEKLQNPQKVLDVLQQYSSSGYIQSPSPLREYTRNKNTYRGNELSRWIIWVSPEERVLHLLPKYAFFDNISIQPEFEQQLTELIETYPHYGFTYYTWSSTQPIRYMHYEHGVNFNLYSQYASLLQNAIEQSVASTNKFLGLINETNHINSKTPTHKLDDPVPEST